MNEIDFRNWLVKNGWSVKVAGDVISRLKRIEREIKDCDIDEQYYYDKCELLMQAFAKMGNNSEMKKYPNTNLPIGKYYMNTYRHALKLYVQFLEKGLR